jgi:hypothetical protein
MENYTIICYTLVGPVRAVHKWLILSVDNISTETPSHSKIVSWGKGSWSITQYMVGRMTQVPFLRDNCVSQWALSWTVESEYHGQIRTISFLWKKRESVADIHSWLAAMCVWRNCPPSRRTVLQWAETFNSGHENVKEWIIPGHLPTACTSPAVQQVSCIITEKRCVIIDEP